MRVRTEQIWELYHERLLNFIQGRLGKAPVADDILQKVFIRIHSQINTLKD